MLKSVHPKRKHIRRFLWFRVKPIRNNVQIVIVHVSISTRIFTSYYWIWYILWIFISHIKRYDFQWINNSTEGKKEETAHERSQIEFTPFAMNHRHAPPFRYISLDIGNNLRHFIQCGFLSFCPDSICHFNPQLPLVFRIATVVLCHLFW